MAKRLYVGNLSYSTTSEALQEFFGAFGVVDSAQVLSDRETGRSRGFGFVEFANDAEADAAIAGLDGNDFQGRRLNVSDALARTPNGGGGPRGGGSRGGSSRGGGGRGGFRGGDRPGRY